MLLELSTVLLYVFVIIFFYLFQNYVYKAERFSEIDRAKKRKKFIIYTGSWLLYNIILSYSGTLQTYDLPPRFPILVIIPIFIFIFRFLRSKELDIYLEQIPRVTAIIFQSFRIFVELIIYGGFINGYLPIEVTFAGYNYEMFAGIMFLFLGFLVFVFNVIPEKIAYYSNFLGLGFLAFIVFAFISLTFFPQLWNYNQAQVSLKFIEMPFIFIASTFMPAAVFMHLFSIKQYKKLYRRI